MLCLYSCPPRLQRCCLSGPGRISRAGGDENEAAKVVVFQVPVAIDSQFFSKKMYI